MAEGSYVPAFDSLWTSPKIRRLKDELHLASMEVAGAKFLKLMQWARDRVESGELGAVDPGLLAEAMGLERRRGGDVIQALRRAQLVSTQGPGKVHGWAEGPGRIIERRRHEREKKARQRGGGRDEQGRLTGDSQSRPPGHSLYVPRDSTGDVPRDRETVSPGTSPGLLTRRTYTPIPPPGDTGNGREYSDQVLTQATEPWRSALVQLYGGFQQRDRGGAFALLFVGSELEVHEHEATVRVASDMAREHVREYLVDVRNAVSSVLNDPEVTVRLEVRGSA